MRLIGLFYQIVVFDFTNNTYQTEIPETIFDKLNIRLVFSGSTFRRVFDWILGSFVNIIVIFAGKHLDETGNFRFIARKRFIIQLVEHVIQR